MKVGIRKPSIKGRVSARLSVKRMIRAKVRAPKGYGLITSPKKAIYNRVYSRTSISADRLVKYPFKASAFKNGNESSSTALNYKNKKTGYILLGMGLIGLCGLHRIYLGKIGTGLIWFFTFGLLGWGQIYDAFQLGKKIDEHNQMVVNGE